MDIKSGCKYPASALSNFAPHPFTFRGVECNSMEGLLQSVKFKNPEMQKHICSLVGLKAKYAGKNKKWFRDQTLYWQGIPIERKSQEYQDLLDEAYEALSKNTKFRAALLASGDSVLCHSIGKTEETSTVLTVREFCSRLMKLRKKIREEDSPKK